MSKTIAVYNRSNHIFKHPSVVDKDTGRPVEWFTLPAQSNGDVPEAIWKHWQTALSSHELVHLIVGGAASSDSNQKLTAATDRATTAEKKLADKEKELENLQALLSKYQADKKR